MTGAAAWPAGGWGARADCCRLLAASCAVRVTRRFIMMPPTSPFRSLHTSCFAWPTWDCRYLYRQQDPSVDARASTDALTGTGVGAPSALQSLECRYASACIAYAQPEGVHIEMLQARACCSPVQSSPGHQIAGPVADAFLAALPTAQEAPYLPRIPQALVACQCLIGLLLLLRRQCVWQFIWHRPRSSMQLESLSS